jgi:hypothetical protein
MGIMEIITWAAEDDSCPIRIKLLFGLYHNFQVPGISLLAIDILTQPALEWLQQRQPQDDSAINCRCGEFTYQNASVLSFTPFPRSQFVFEHQLPGGFPKA